jgi:FlaA1/EpsC-like NDP-sugar epimerase
MMFRLRNRHFFLIDALFCVLIPIFALRLRLNNPIPLKFLPTLIVYILTALLIKLPVFYYFGLYRRFWPYASVDAMVSIGMAVMVAMVMVTGVFYVLNGFVFLIRPGLPRSIPFFDGLMTATVVLGSRFSVRAITYYRYLSFRNTRTRLVLIAGAGDAGQIVARELLASDTISKRLFGYVDDNPDKNGTIIHGVRVWGPLDAIPVLAGEYNIEEVIIAMPKAPGSVIRKVVNACEEANISSKILPGVYKVLAGQANINRLREVEVGDLLRREPVGINLDQIEKLLTDKVVLITGGGGSIGSEMCAQIANCNPARLIVLGRGENSLYSLRNKIEKAGFGHLIFNFILADIRDQSRLESVYERYKPEIVYHTAAHKHVPLMEENVDEAVTNNIFGTWNLVQVSKKYDVEKFVFISTDKAVKPASVMGMTKRLAELIVRMAATETNRPYLSVRFGNVLGSRGSVIPLFKRQIAMGGPVTVTHPDMERYFMTMSEATYLVLQASALGQNGDVFVLDMGEPISITDLARDMIELAGRQVDEDIKIVYTGIRPGERLSEHLFFDEEDRIQTAHEKIFVVRNGLSTTMDSIGNEIKTLEQLANDGLVEELRKKLIQYTT